MSNPVDSSIINPKLSSLNIDHTTWVPCATLDYQNNRAHTDSFVKFLTPCSFIKDIRLSTRLGSASVVGIVMKYAPPEDQEAIFALKVIPAAKIIDPATRREISISRYLSSTKSLYFPRFYGWGICKDTIFPGDTKPTPSTYMLYELLSFDLRQFLTTILSTLEVSEEFLIQLLTKIFMAMEDLARRGISHPDIHTGNIMFRCLSIEDIEPVIIDFGSCTGAKDILQKFDPASKSLSRIESIGGLGEEALVERLKTCPGYRLLMTNISAEFKDSRFPRLSEAIRFTTLATKTDSFTDPGEYRQFFLDTAMGGNVYSKLREKLTG